MFDQKNAWTKLTVSALAVWLFTDLPSATIHHISAGEKTLVSFGMLDGPTRKRLDGLVRAAPPGTSKFSRHLETYADTSAFLLSRVRLSAEEESRRADEEYQKLVQSDSVQRAPAEVQEVVEHLERELSENLKGGTSRFEVFLIGDSARTTFTLGSGRIYLSRTYFEGLYSHPKTDRERLAFALAHEMGHVCRGHVRRRYQSEWLIEQTDRVIVEKAESTAGAAINKLLVRGIDGCLRFLYSLDEDIQADLFALHLCRNAGFEGETILDPLRERMIAAAGGIPAGIDTQRPGREARRLRALLLERSGYLSDEGYGLLMFDVEAQQFREADEESVPAGARAVVFVHGMGSNPQKFQKLATAVVSEESHLLAFRYPNNGSLALAGKYLAKEVNRVCPKADHLDFVCHSAGGLVFRWYAEVEGGPFHRAVMIGTPHGGSSLARLREFFDFVRFIKDFTFEDVSLLEQILREPEGQIGFDLQPGSLFLSSLDRASIHTLRDRYTIIRGRALKRSYSLLLRGSVKTGKIAMQNGLARQELRSEWREVIQNWIAKLQVPPEISAGDFAVTLESAALEGAKRIETVAANHIKLVDHERTIALVREILDED